MSRLHPARRPALALGAVVAVAASGALASLGAGNDRSARVLLALGMQPEGVRRQHLRKGGEIHDVHLYGRLRAP